MKSYFLFVAAMVCCCVLCQNAVAQKAGAKCKPGFKEDENGVCRPGKGKPPRNPPLSAKTCTINISVSGAKSGMYVTVYETVKNGKEDGGTDLPTNSEGKIEYRNQNCTNAFRVVPQSDSYTFEPEERKYEKLSQTQTAVFTATPKEKAPPFPTPKVEQCKEPEVKNLGSIRPANSYSNLEQIIAAEPCKSYYNEYKFTSTANRQSVGITIDSPELAVLDLKLSYNKTPIVCSQSSSNQNSRTWQCELPSAGEHALQVTSAKPNSSYTLTIRNNGLVDAEYRDQIEKIRSSLVSSKSDTIFEALNKQISIYRYHQREWGSKDERVPLPPAKEQTDIAQSKLEAARKSLEFLEKVDSPRGQTYTLLAIICCYGGGNNVETLEKAVLNNGEARFRVRLSKSKNDESRYRYWLLIRQSGLSIEKLEYYIDDKPITEKWAQEQVKNSKLSESSIEIEVITDKTKFYITPISKDKSEAKVINDLIQKYALKNKR